MTSLVAIPVEQTATVAEENAFTGNLTQKSRSFFRSWFLTSTKDAKRHAIQAKSRSENNDFRGWDFGCYVPITKFDIMLALLRKGDGTLVIKSPPGSGKTTMAQAFCKYHEERGHIVYFVTLLGSDNKTSDDFWKASWGRGEGVTFKDVCDRAAGLDPKAEPIFVIIDETQKWYQDRNEF